MTETRPARRHLSARARIVGAMVGLIAVAFAAALIFSAQILTARTNAMLDERLTHAATSFRTFALSPSGSSQSTVEQLLTRYLRDTVANPAETTFSLVDGVPHRRTAGDPPARLDRDPVFLDLVSGARAPVHGQYKSSAGTVAYAVIPVQLVGD